jgi:P4 family phage/plasmid primase-like protien
MPKDFQKIDLSINNEVQAFLNDRRSNEKGLFTHTSIGRPQGVYNIPESEINIFNDLYHKVVFDDNIDIHLTEKVSDLEFSPFKIDIDLRYYNTDAVRIYTPDDIDAICKLYILNIEDWLSEPSEEERIFFILEKQTPVFDYTKKGKKKENDEGLFRIKDGIHIIAPFLVTVPHLQHNIRECVYKTVGPIFDKYKFDNPYSDIFDRAVIDSNNWQMYGSRKPHMQAYSVTRIIKVWSDRIEEIPLNKYTNRELISILSMRSKDDGEGSLIRPEKEELVYKMNQDYLEAKGTKRYISGKKRNKNKAKLSKEELILVYKYIDCLSAERAKSYPTWIEVGWCLHNLHNRNNKLLLKWIEFSKKAADYADDADDSCTEYWENMCNDGLGIASLKLWAKQDNPEQYSKIVQEDIYTHIIEACKTKKGSSYDVAKVMHAMYKDYYVCISVKDTLWYYYDQNKNCWRTDDRGIMLKSKISTEVYLEFKKIAEYKIKSSVEAGDDANEMYMKILNVMARLKETSFKSNLMTECSELFYDREKTFLEKLDSNNNLIGFRNGVYDLLKDELRKGRPEDYVSLSTNINYIEYAPASNEVKDIYNMLETIFVIKEVREYVMKRLSSFLSGSTKDEAFDIFSGGGGNGKSKIMELLENAIGEYAVKLPISLLTAKRAASNAATPELAATKGKRIATLQEPDSDTKLNVGLMKELTGGDKIQARALYREPFEFKPQFKLVLCCNDKPQLPPNDEGTWRRVRNTEFITSYRHKPDESRVLQFKIDESLSEKFDNWTEPFMSILIHYHKLYKKYGLMIPDEINEYTQEYRATGNHFRDFVNEQFEEIQDDSGSVRLLQAYDAYRQWYSDNHADKNWKKRKEFQAFMDEKYKTKNIRGAKEKCYIGIKLCNKGTDDHSYIDNEDCVIDELDA